MSFTARTYEEIVRDLLTALTGGTVRETADVTLDAEGEVKPIKLFQRPVRRISYVEERRVNIDNTEETIRYTPVDYVLVSSEDEGGELDSLEFRQGGRKPVVGSLLTINYYPLNTDPVPVTDLNVGSVVRTMMETFSRELAMTELQLEHVYRSAFLETAAAGSLDKVVALIGLRRFPAGHAVATLRFARNPITPGKITVPTGTVVTDADGHRYKTLSELILESSERTREVLAGAENPATPEVESDALNRFETLVAGIESVTNPKPARNLSAPETDEELRTRAKGALHGISFGTLNALKYGIMSIPGVNTVTLTEFPNDIPGEVRVDIAYGEDSPAVRAEVQERIIKFKPAGVRVITGEAERIEVRVSVQLTLAGTGVAENEVGGLKQGVESAIRGYLDKLAPGSKVRRAQMSSLVLADNRIVDCAISLLPGDQPAVEELSLSANQIIDTITPFDFPLIESEELPAPLSRSVVVDAIVPYIPVSGVTEQEARDALKLALDNFISTRSTGNIITVDELAAVLRDDSRYALVREDMIVTVEVEETFLQLTDGLGSFAPEADDSISKGDVTFELREGGHLIMSHLDQMTERLPHLYKDGELLRMVLAVPALNLEAFDEQALEIQRSHWFDTAFEFEDVAKIAALLDLQPETWQGLREFRAWVHSLRNAWLKNGTATRQPLQDFVDEYTNRYQAAVRINAVTSLGNWSNEPSQTRPALVENPMRRKYEQLPAGVPIEPLHQQLVRNRGLDESVGDFFIMGLAGGKEYMPVIANTTTGQALIYTGIIGAGDRLWLQTLDDNTVKAYTDKLDVSDRLYSIDTLQPGVSWEGADTHRPAQALNLRPGDNNLWFLPVAHYDKPGLDRALLGLAELTLEQGRWDETRMDQSLFYQDPLMILWASWQESQPASIEITVPGGILINSAGQTETALENRDRLQFSLNLGIQKIKAAGISATTRVLAFSDVQPSRDALCDIYPKTFREAGSSGIDSLPDSGGAFDVTEHGKSVFR